MPHAHGLDPIALLDARIRLARSRRAACERFTEAYWAADDDLTWLRMVRDELARTGHVRDEVRALLETPATGVAVDASAGAPDLTQLPATRQLTSQTDLEAPSRETAALGAA